MNMKYRSIRKTVSFFACGAGLSAGICILISYLLEQSAVILLCLLLLGAVLFLWGAFLLRYMQVTLSRFTNDLCGLLDGMIYGKERPEVDFTEETAFSRIAQRLERLYEIMQENKRKTEAEKASLQSLVSDISHQTKTPIANLKMINDTLLSRSMPEEKRREFLQAMQGQLEKLDFLVRAMVKTSRLETGMIALEKKSTLFTDTLSLAVNGVLSRMEKKGIALSVECPEDLLLLHDSRWTAEAIHNLLDNAVKYTPRDGRIQVKVEQWEMHVRVDVTDTGCGISENEQAAIFKRFYRGREVRDVEGIGLGLFLAREIVTMQGGYIKVRSAIGRGSTVSVFLPLQRRL